MKAFRDEGFIRDDVVSFERFQFFKKMESFSSYGDEFWDKLVVHFRQAREQKKGLYWRPFRTYTPEEWKKDMEEDLKLCGVDFNKLGFDPFEPDLDGKAVNFAIAVHNKWDEKRGARNQLTLVEVVEIKSDLYYNTMIHEMSLKLQNSDSKVANYEARVSTDTIEGKMYLRDFCNVDIVIYGHRSSWPPQAYGRLDERHESEDEYQESEDEYQESEDESQESERESDASPMPKRRKN